MNSVCVKVYRFVPKSSGVPREINFLWLTGVYSSIISVCLGISTSLNLSGKFVSY